jgi:cytochrome d ubiquinol oxidase subunit I
VLFTLAGFVAIYTVLLVIELKLMVKAIRKGPVAEHSPDEGDARSHVPPAHAVSTTGSAA